MPEEPRLSPDLTDQERIELTAMRALLVQNQLAYVRYAYKHGVVSRRGGRPVTNWYQTVDDERCQGWQAALNALAHTYGETSNLYHHRARIRKANQLTETTEEQER